MKAFIIGAAGFVGGHLMDEMLRLGWTVGASKMPQETIISCIWRRKALSRCPGKTRG